MGGRLGVDVGEGEGVFVLIDALGGDVAGDDLAEEAIHKARCQLGYDGSARRTIWE